MMKVILDTSVVPGEGSSYHYFSELIPRLRKEPGLNVEVLPSPYCELPKEWFSERPAYRPLPVKGSWLPAGKIRTFLSQAKQSIEKYRQVKTLYKDAKDTIFHSFYYTSPSDERVRFVCLALDTVTEKLGDELKITDSFKSFLNQKQKALEKADRIISISHSTKQDICDIYGISTEKVDTIYLSVHSDYHNQSPSGLSLLSEPYLLQVGGRMHHRNFKRLAEAFAIGGLHKDYLLACVGMDWSEEELLFLKQLGIESRVRLFKNLDNSKLRTLYQKAEMLVYPSLYEGFGFPLVEAMACGTPVATSKGAGSIPEVAGDAAVYFDPRDPKDIAQRISDLLDPKLAALYIQKGFENVKRFSWDQTAKETMECYRKIISF